MFQRDEPRAVEGVLGRGLEAVEPTVVGQGVRTRRSDHQPLARTAQREAQVVPVVAVLAEEVAFIERVAGQDAGACKRLLVMLKRRTHVRDAVVKMKPKIGRSALAFITVVPWQVFHTELTGQRA